MISKVAAVTVAPFYFDEVMRAIKLMGVYRDRSRKYRWSVLKSLKIAPKSSTLTKEAQKIARSLGVPFIRDLTQRSPLSPDEIDRLVELGILTPKRRKT